MRLPRRLREAEALAHWLVVAPLVACLPAHIAYLLVCWRGTGLRVTGAET
jgi:hypothetical protein